MNCIKTTRKDRTVIQFLTVLDEFNIDKITYITYELYNSGDRAKNLIMYIFVVLPQKSAVNRCELNRPISLMCHIVKRTKRILMNKSCSRIRPEVGQEKRGFVKKKEPMEHELRLLRSELYQTNKTKAEGWAKIFCVLFKCF